MKAQDDVYANVLSELDEMKLKSCMTRFASTSSGASAFDRVLDQYFHGELDSRTLQLLKAQNL